MKSLSASAVCLLALLGLARAAYFESIRNIEQRALQNYMLRHNVTLEEITGNRIVGGVEATEDEAPFQAELYGRSYFGFIYQFMCGASLISPSTLLSAGHCVSGLTKYKARYGTNDRLKSSYSDISISDFIRHPDYRSLTLQNDLALFILDQPVKPSSNVRSISLQTEPVVANSTVSLFGFGITNGHNKFVEIKLRTTTLDVISEEECQEYIESIGRKKHPGMMCASASGRSACYGDSGGPLVYAGNLTGIVSFGTRHCPPGAVNVFTNVSYYLDWIYENIEQ